MLGSLWGGLLWVYRSGESFPTVPRSLYIAEDIRAGTELTPENLRIETGLGLPPKYYDVLLGRKVNQDLKKGSAMKWEMVG